MAVLQRKHKDNGYLLAEWLMGIFLYGIIISGLYMGIAGYEKVLAVIQVENAAREFAQDILRTRERALAGSEQGFIELSNGRKGYRVYRRPNLVDKKRGFASAGSEALQFSSIPAYTIKFSVNGSPSASGLFVLQHERIKSARVKVSLQPVTGRVKVERVK
ncbi:MAG: hypothetical protein J6P76_07115 [Acidaminococcaceae bacterium]|nr:hypothetical protein [Acidaminococcaceae bacterium]MBO6038634.1 hypothetical protein [Acidaminococcaceae bacterium]MBP5737207.1 hypothetical protein [Acidaminococcaceae bacterium]